MEQLPLFSDGELKPILQYLHVWSEAERARAIKNPGTVRPYTCAGGNPPERAEEAVNVMRLSQELRQTHPGEGHSE